MNYGTKANNLFKMREANINVPYFIVLSWEQLVGQDFDISELIKDINFNNKEELEKTSISLQMFLSNKLKKTLKDFDCNEKFAEVLGKDKRINEFSVRSSTANEDGESTSFAGQFDTYLNVSYRNLEEYILRCAKSLYKVNVLSYCNEQKIPLEELKMNIIIQEMVEPEYSGILFTSNPMGILNESVIVVGPGVGSGVVEDKVDTTTYYYNTTDNLYYYETQSDNCVILSEERVEELINLSKNLVSIFGDKLDIEFAVCDGVLYILQARKITTLSEEKVVVLDNSNIVESYPGVSLPFTDSFVNLAYTGVFKGVCHRIIKDKKYLESLEDVYQNMVGSCNGRMYYKISNWYHILKGMPSSKKIIKNWQEMLGVEIKTYDDTKMKLSPFTKIAVYTNIIKEINKSQKNMSKLNEDFVEINSYFKEKYSKELTNKELVVLFEQVKSKVLDNWDITLINDMYAFIYTGLLKGMLKMDKVPEYEQVTNNYISGITNIESMKPIKGLLELSKLALDKDMVGKEPSKDKEFEYAFYDYIDNYGDRALEELKIESKTFRSNPELLTDKIVNYTSDIDKFNKMLENINAESYELNKDILGKACFIDRAIIKAISKKATNGIKSREISRLNRSRIYGIVRTIIIQIGKNFEREDKIDSYEDIFYLYMNEIFDYINDENVELDFKEIVKERKEKYKLYRKLPAYTRLVFSGDSFNKQHRSINSVDIYDNNKKMSGTPCSGGEIEGEVLVINDVSEVKDVKDKILVTKMTDPGWVFLLVEAKGIITEKGSLLSHTAIISRELNIPAVVGVKNVCNTLKTGNKVKLNGNTGEIEVM